MARLILILMVAACAIAGTVQPASAKPAVPEGCTFELGFAAFREALGEEIVGECESNQAADPSGDAKQVTSDGVLFWQASRNEVSFHNGSQRWINGPQGDGIRSNVTVSGLGNRQRHNEPVTAPANVVFAYAALLPEEVGSDWWYGDVPMAAPLRLNPACYPNRPDPTFGSTNIWFLNEESGSAFIQMLDAVADGEVGGVRARMEAEIAACDGWTETSRRGVFRQHLRIEPFVQLGDDSALLEYEIENVETGERHSSRSAYVRYGGLVSTLAVLSPERLPRDASIAELERLARLADASVRTAAWYLRD